MLSPVLAQLATIVSAFIFTPIALKSLGVSQFGVYVILMTLIGIGGLLTFGAGDATERLVAKYRERDDQEKLAETIKSGIFTFSVLSLLISGLLYLLAHWLMVDVFSVNKEEVGVAIHATQIASLALIFAIPSEIFIACLKGFQRFGRSSLSTAIVTLLTAGVNIFLLLQGYGLLSLAIMLVVSRFLLLVVSFCFTLKSLPDKRWVIPSFSLTATKETLGFGIYLWVGSLFNRIRAEGLPLIIGAILSPAATGIYSVASRPLSALMSVIQQGTIFLMPHLTRIYESGDHESLRQKYQQAIKISVILAGMVCAAFAFLAPTFYPLWLQETATPEIILIAGILALRYAVLPMGSVISQFMKAAGKGKMIVFIQVISCAVLLLATWIGAQYAGVVGVAWAQCTVYFLIILNGFMIEKALFGKGNLGFQICLLLGASIPTLLIHFLPSAETPMLVTLCLTVVVSISACILSTLMVGGFKDLKRISIRDY